jgi:threonine/homoserine efflux transporter RhtA
MALDHETPTALRVRPTVTIRQIPGRLIRVPARSGTLILIALICWGLGLAVSGLPWYVLAGMTLIPASIFALLVELKPHGKAPLGWVYVMLRHRRRAAILIMRRLATHRPAGRRS